MAINGFIQAAHYSPGAGQRKPIRMIVLHSAENQELEGQAKHLAQWFAGSTAPQASAHYMVDDKQVWQSVKDTDIAWAVDVWEANLESISIELTGKANQSSTNWVDTYSTMVLKEATSLCKSLSSLHGIPTIHLTLPQILDGKTKGYCTHADITAAHKIVGGHTDPGPNFPMDQFLKEVAV
jgi:N-acetyl-anhydromuramyl-L-alanine amidase AmpD